METPVKHTKIAEHPIPCMKETYAMKTETLSQETKNAVTSTKESVKHTQTSYSMAVIQDIYAMKTESAPLEILNADTATAKTVAYTKTSNTMTANIIVIKCAMKTESVKHPARGDFLPVVAAGAKVNMHKDVRKCVQNMVDAIWKQTGETSMHETRVKTSSKRILVITIILQPLPRHTMEVCDHAPSARVSNAKRLQIKAIY